MGERKTRLNGGSVEQRARDDHEREPQRIEREIESIRDDLGGLVRELDRRRHAAFDWRGQLQRHRRELLFAAGAIAVLIAGGASLQTIRRRRLDRPRARMERIVEALRVVASDPEALARAVEANRTRRTS